MALRSSEFGWSRSYQSPRLVLCAEDHGSLIAPGLNYFQQTIGFLRRQAPDQPFVQNQQIIFLVRFNKGCSGRKIFT